MTERIQASPRTVRQDYFDWLVGRTNGGGHLMMLKDLFDREFISIFPHDENRILDGLDLRAQYFEEEPYCEETLNGYPCSCFEMIFALAQRMAFETALPYESISELSDVDWFWRMLENLGVAQYDDERYVELDGAYNVSEALDVMIYRSYGPDGQGGLFPLRRPTVDARNMELWYQMQNYVKETEEVGIL